MKNKKSIILTIIAVTVLLVAVVGATYAYFTAGGGASTSANVKVETSNQDILTFEVGDPINIEVTQTTFSTGKGNASGNTKAKAILKTANEENELKANYYLYLNIGKNEFGYTTEDNTAELLLKITDPSGNQVTSLDGLTYKTVTDGSNNSQSGFDITTKTGLITIANNKEIKAKPETTEEWKVEIIFVNLNEDQSANAGKSLTAKLILQKERVPQVLADVCSNGDNLATCIKNLSDNSYSNLTSIYKHDTNLTNGAGDNSYRYAGANYSLTDLAYSSNYTRLYSTSSDYESSTDNLIDFYCNNEKKYVNSYCNSSYYYKLAYNNEAEYDSFIAVHNQAVIDGYLQYNVNNYVCFGSNSSNCPDEKIYRIIGVFDDNTHGQSQQALVKLIKNDYGFVSELGGTGVGDYKNNYADDFTRANYKSYYKGSLSYANLNLIGSYYWNNATSTSVWGESLLNQQNFNTYFLNHLNNSWSNKIQSITWKVTKNNLSNLIDVPSATTYQNEITSPVSTENVTAKVGLMYLSDYGFAADPIAWDTNLGNYCNVSNNIIFNNWLNRGLIEWSLSIGDVRSGGIVYIGCCGGPEALRHPTASAAVRQTFYLTQNTKYVSGKGTYLDPIILS